MNKKIQMKLINQLGYIFFITGIISLFICFYSAYILLNNKNDQFYSLLFLYYGVIGIVNLILGNSFIKEE